MIAKARMFADQVHHGQFDRDGRPHIDHVDRVALLVSDRYADGDPDFHEMVVTAALLHDTNEDGEQVSAATLLGGGFPVDVVKAVELLSRPRELTYMEYVAQVAEAPGLSGDLARAVKRADLDDNIRRCQEADEQSMLRRYRKAQALLPQPA